MGRARVTGDRQREKTEDTPMPRACGCPPPSSSAARSPSLQPVRSPCSVLRFLPSLSHLICHPSSPRVYPRHFLSPLFAFFPLAVLVLAFPLLRARSSSAPSFLVPSRVYSFRRCSLLSFSSSRVLPPSPPPPPLIFFPFVFLPARSHLFAPFLPYLFLLLPLPLAVPLPASTSSPARAIARAVPPFLHSNLFLA